MVREWNARSPFLGPALRSRWATICSVSIDSLCISPCPFILLSPHRFQLHMPRVRHSLKTGLGGNCPRIFPSIACPQPDFPDKPSSVTVHYQSLQLYNTKRISPPSHGACSPAQTKFNMWLDHIRPLAQNHCFVEPGITNQNCTRYPLVIKPPTLHAHNG